MKICPRAILYTKNQFGLLEYSHAFKSYMIIDILKLCFDLQIILVRWINWSSVRDLSLLLGFKLCNIPSAARSKNYYYAKSSPIFEFGHIEQFVKGILGTKVRERKREYVYSRIKQFGLFHILHSVHYNSIITVQTKK